MIRTDGAMEVKPEQNQAEKLNLNIKQDLKLTTTGKDRKPERRDVNQ